MPAIQGRYWICTWSAEHAGEPRWDSYIGTDSIVWIRGQLELGEGGFRHWQFIVGYSKKVTLSRVSSKFRGVHAELSRSTAADTYVWKDDTRVAGTQFEFGGKPIRRNNADDWDGIKRSALAGDFDSIPSDVFIRYYSSLRRIHKDYLRPVAMVRTCRVFWGQTGTGKSHRAWAEGGDNSYIKDPRTKWWCGYQAQEAVIIDEFRGVLDISHLLRWLDRYPVLVETKGGAMPLMASKFWITSNLHPKDWYPDLDAETYRALERRIEIIHFANPFQINLEN